MSQSHVLPGPRGGTRGASGIRRNDRGGSNHATRGGSGSTRGFNPATRGHGPPKQGTKRLPPLPPAGKPAHSSATDDYVGSTVSSARATRTCVNCGKELSRASRFCNGCGDMVTSGSFAVTDLEDASSSPFLPQFAKNNNVNKRMGAKIEKIKIDVPNKAEKFKKMGFHPNNISAGHLPIPGLPPPPGKWEKEQKKREKSEEKMRRKEEKRERKAKEQLISGKASTKLWEMKSKEEDEKEVERKRKDEKREEKERRKEKKEEEKVEERRRKEEEKKKKEEEKEEEERRKKEEKERRKREKESSKESAADLEGDTGAKIVVLTKWENVVTKEDLEANNGLFGRPLSDLMNEQRTTHPSLQVPAFIHHAIQFLWDSNAVLVEGIFRRSPPFEELQSLRDQLNRKENRKMDFVALAAANPSFQIDPIHVSSMIKTFLRELPDPLLTRALYPLWMAINLSNKETAIADVKHLIAQLPPENKSVLEILLSYLGDIVNEPSNKMGSNALAIVIGPNFLWSTGLDIEEMQRINGLAQLMIENHPKLFARGRSRPHGIHPTTTTTTEAAPASIATTATPTTPAATAPSGGEAPSGRGRGRGRGALRGSSSLGSAPSAARDRRAHPEDQNQTPGTPVRPEPPPVGDRPLSLSGEQRRVAPPPIPRDRKPMPSPPSAVASIMSPTSPRSASPPSMTPTSPRSASPPSMTLTSQNERDANARGRGSSAVGRGGRGERGRGERGRGGGGVNTRARGYARGGRGESALSSVASKSKVATPLPHTPGRTLPPPPGAAKSNGM